MPLQEHLNHALDRFVRPTVQVRRHALPAFQLCGCAGLELAVLLALGLVLYRGLSPWVMGAIIGAAIVTFYVVAFATKIVSGEEQLIYYHHEIAVMFTAALVVWALRQPALGYLDATILGIGAFLACGRVGCLMVGCCHGRPHRWGVRYRSEHAEAGFPRCYVGARLFPIQAVESLWVGCIVLSGTLMILHGAAPGAALAWYVVLYDLGRFCFEFVRGDADRPYHAGFSEGQWLSLLLTWLVAGAELAGLLPLRVWHPAVALGLALVMLALAAWQRRSDDLCARLLRPHHVQEVAAAISAPGRPGAPLGVTVTSLGIAISAGSLDAALHAPRHYTISHQQLSLNDQAVATLARLFLNLRPGAGGYDVVRGEHGAVHLIGHAAE